MGEEKDRIGERSGLDDSASIFILHGVGFYLAGRFITLTANPVAGILLCDAVRMLLTAAVLEKGTAAERKRSLATAKLECLWPLAKERFSESALGKFDPLIASLSDFEIIRTLPVGQSVLASVGIGKNASDPPFSSSEGVVICHVSLTDVDELVASLASLLDIPSVSFTGIENVNQEWMEPVYRTQNPHAYEDPEPRETEGKV